ncbi:Copia protein [Eufriesea mexicana]|uniref:Copia protein n=1 Tax=Eufriesea mexicana TaxID=516756 RepID=A0A310SVL1_9HYME|nr:Copia protein [Eufriesea mexicana]
MSRTCSSCGCRSQGGDRRPCQQQSANEEFRSQRGRGYSQRRRRRKQRDHSKKVLFEPCPPYVHELNGTAERYNRTTINSARYLLSDSKTNITYWPEIVKADAYLGISVLTNTVEMKTPIEISFKWRPNIEYLRLYIVEDEKLLVFNEEYESDDSLESVCERTESERVHENVLKDNAPERVISKNKNKDENLCEIELELRIPVRQTKTQSDMALNHIVYIKTFQVQLRKNESLGLVDKQENKKIIDSKLVFTSKADDRKEIKAGWNEGTLMKVKAVLSKGYAMRDLGEVKTYVGINIDYDFKEGAMRLDLKYYVGTSVKRYKIEDNADWTEWKTDGKSTTGYIIRLLEDVIFLKSRKQENVSKSSAADEYVALSEAVREIKFLKKQLTDFDVDIEKPINISQDNSGATAISKYGDLTKNSKYNDVHYHFVHECCEHQEADIANIDSANNVADTLTKALGRINNSRMTEYGASVPRVIKNWRHSTEYSQHKSTVGVGLLCPLVMGNLECFKNNECIVRLWLELSAIQFVANPPAEHCCLRITLINSDVHSLAVTESQMTEPFSFETLAIYNTELSRAMITLM